MQVKSVDKSSSVMLATTVFYIFVSPMQPVAADIDYKVLHQHEVEQKARLQQENESLRFKLTSLEQQFTTD